MTRQAAQPDLLTVPEAAKLLRRDKSDVYHYVRTGQLEHYRFPDPKTGEPGGTIRIERAEVQRFLAACKRPATGRAS